MNIRISNVADGVVTLSGNLKFLLPLFALVASISGCAVIPEWFGSPGPTNEQVQEQRENLRLRGIQFVDINAEVADKLAASRKQSLFSESFGVSTQSRYVIGAGDVIELSLWEAPPAMLFGIADMTSSAGASTARVTTFPEQMVSGEGMINIPFAGQIRVAGRTPLQIEADVARRLKDKANQPQVLVRVIRNNTANVTLVGEVTSSVRMPLTARGERLLDALAAAGGVRQPVDKITIQVTRGSRTHTLALNSIISDPKQNIMLQPGDVITALYQPLSLTVLGATTKNVEIPFEEAQGITLAQALARAGGLNSEQADAQAVFIFRFENSQVLDWPTPLKTTPKGTVPVVYQMNLKDPASFLVAQNFPMDNKDVLYVANAPGDNFRKFMAILFQSFFILRSIGSFAGGF